MISIYILVFIALTILVIALYKKDFGLILISAFIIILVGLFSMNNGFGDLPLDLSKSIGLIFIFTGVYLALKSSFDLMLPLKNKTAIVK
jgi:hypothetical protein